jgi:hypothetical protein
MGGAVRARMVSSNRKSTPGTLGGTPGAQGHGSIYRGTGGRECCEFTVTGGTGSRKGVGRSRG